jgi:hypothetical protein
MLARIGRLDARCAEFGWMLDFLTPGWLTRELLPVMKKLESRYANLGMFLAKDGVKQPGFRNSSACCATADRCWIKFTGVYRMSVAPGFTDAGPMARAIIEAPRPSASSGAATTPTSPSPTRWGRSSSSTCSGSGRGILGCAIRRCSLPSDDVNKR